MASTYTLQNTITAISPYVNFKPVNLGGSLEPAKTIANTVQQAIVSPPFSWPWNRNTATFTTTSGTMDYAQAVSDWGFAEKASVSDGTTTHELEIRNILGTGKESSRPAFLAPQLDDNAGNITFRLLPVPDATYTITVTYQKKLPLISSLFSAWAIPDYLGYLYNDGFLALTLLFMGDSRFQFVNQRFTNRLLHASMGLTQQAKDQFLAEWEINSREAAASALNLQQGIQAQGGL